jgi:hypothetical protein
MDQAARARCIIAETKTSQGVHTSYSSIAPGEGIFSGCRPGNPGVLSGLPYCGEAFAIPNRTAMGDCFPVNGGQLSHGRVLADIISSRKSL